MKYKKKPKKTKNNLNLINQLRRLNYLIDCNAVLSLKEDRSRIEAFHAFAGMRTGRRGWDLFLPFLNRDDSFLVNQAARIIAKMACWSTYVTMKHPETTMYLSFLKDQLRSPVCKTALSSLLAHL